MPTQVPAGEGVPSVFYRNAIDLNRFSNGIARKLAQENVNVIVRAVDQLKKIDESKGPSYKAARLRSLIKQTKKTLSTWQEKSVDVMIKDLESVAKVQAGFVEDQLKKALPAGMQKQIVEEIGYSVQSVAVSPGFAKAVVTNTPTKFNLGQAGKFNLTAKQGAEVLLPNGETISKAFRGLAAKQANQFNQIVRTGLLSGEPTSDIVRQLVGNLDFGEKAKTIKQLNMAGGEVTKLATHQINTIVRTSVNQVSNAASQSVYKANKKITKEYRYISTLDSRTSTVCRNLDGQIFAYGKGPEPPQHFGCRSTTVPVIDYKGNGWPAPPSVTTAKRASADGPVPANTTYGKWLYDQRAKTKSGNLSKFTPGPEQVKALGKEKAKYFNRLANKYGPDQAMAKFMREDGSEVTLKKLESRYGKPKDIKPKASSVVKERKNAEYSWQRYSNGSLKEGAEPTSATVWTKDRQKLHDKIVEDIINENNPKPQKNPEFFMTGGGSASGKSIMLKKSPLPKGTVVIDSDEIKKRLPEFSAMQKKGGEIAEAAAGYVHEESSYLSKRLMRETAQRRYHTMLDGTGDNSIKSLQKKVQQMSDRGMKVKAKYATADIETALERNYQRFLKTKRLVPATYVRDVHRNVSKVVPDALQAGIFDDFELYDMNQSGQAIRVANYTKEKGLNIEDQDLWNRFIGKAWQPDSQFTKWTDVDLKKI